MTECLRLCVNMPFTVRIPNSFHAFCWYKPNTLICTIRCLCLICFCCFLTLEKYKEGCVQCILAIESEGMHSRYISTTTKEIQLLQEVFTYFVKCTRQTSTRTKGRYLKNAKQNNAFLVLQCIRCTQTTVCTVMSSKDSNFQNKRG